MLAFPVFFPMAAALLLAGFGRRADEARDNGVILLCLIELVAALALLCLLALGRELTLALPQILGIGMTFRLDGFRALYLLIAGVMWLFSAMLSPEYFAAHRHAMGRYAFFYLMTLGATAGVFLSADLMTTFVFFEIMSFTSYAWVVHDQTRDALDAGETYLAIAIVGGMVLLLGLMWLYRLLGTLEIARLYEAAQAVRDPKALWGAALCILLGFGAKAGMFPLHIWLPKAHPVAPAPASALLSGILTKTGVFGVAIVTLEVYRGDRAWAQLVLVLALLTMLLGAVLAVFSVNLKRTLACSSMSQIGFILTGVAMSSLLGEENALAARGTLLYMMNHSLFKLILFLAAGVVAMNLHKLNLNDVRGFGRNKPVLHFAFLMGALGLMGVPTFSGYVSKTLIHEGIVEYAAHLAHSGDPSSGWIRAAEGIFLFSGGLTAAYMLKLYICLFWEKHPYYQLAYDERRDYLSGMGAAPLVLSALLVPLLGVRPNRTMDPIADFASGFLHSGHLASPTAYFSAQNLEGAAISLSIGLLVYLLFIRPVLMGRDAQGDRVYLYRWPANLDLERILYRPVIVGVLRAFGAVASLGDAPILEDRLAKPALRALLGLAGAMALFLGTLTDNLAGLLSRTVFSMRRRREVSEGHKHHFHGEGLFFGAWEGVGAAFRRFRHTMSYGLVFFGLGLIATLFYLMFYR